MGESNHLPDYFDGISMTDVVLVAFITAASTLAATVVSQTFAARAAARVAERAERQEDLKFERADKQRIRDAKTQRLEALMSEIETAHLRIVEAHTKFLQEGPHLAAAHEVAAAASARAHRITVLSFPEMRPLAYRFHVSTAVLDTSIRTGQDDKQDAATDEWQQALTDLTDAVADAASKNV